MKLSLPLHQQLIKTHKTVCAFTPVPFYPIVNVLRVIPNQKKMLFKLASLVQLCDMFHWHTQTVKMNVIPRKMCYTVVIPHSCE